MTIITTVVKSEALSTATVISELVIMGERLLEAVTELKVISLKLDVLQANEEVLSIDDLNDTQ